MFSQFRQVVETFVQESTHPGGESSADTRSRSLDVNTSRSPSSTQLPEPALSNLRKSLAVQRVASTSPQRRSTSPGPSSLPKNSADTSARKSRLEERLRASFTIGDSPGSPTPNATPSRASPAPDAIRVTQHPLSPESIPLPGSPTQVAPDPPANDPVVPISSSQPSVSITNESDVPVDDLGSSSPQPQDSIVPPGAQDQVDVTAHVSADAGATVSYEPISVASEVDTSPSAADNEQSSSVAVNSSDADVEALRERLKLVEQRFSDVSTSFKKLQAERLVADTVIRELTPLEDTKDIAALRDYLTNINMKVEVGTRSSSIRILTFLRVVDSRRATASER
ncbi:hypothetical protein SCLCIDRAFT_109168 [Scleroderma citrinum Foug A]|uniref:Uncharacterized protein n=1 Tax=Scleroderma citrinum Foug A TaxID=1036808 RepID=A0A0C3EG17_9AGAM|nr:hypothetical protein SCLCIDRAFT_109168 [Scleroderma citrinum Foug A]